MIRLFFFLLLVSKIFFVFIILFIKFDVGQRQLGIALRFFKKYSFVHYILPMCCGDVKSVDYPTMDDRLSNEVLKSSDRLKQKKWMANGHSATDRAISRMVYNGDSNSVLPFVFYRTIFSRLL